ncbi:MAG: elongator complex protein 3 [Peptococcaceae bacterium]
MKAENVLIIPIFIPHLGCPHTCVFCNQHKIAGAYACPDTRDIIDTAERYLKTAGKRKITRVEIAFYGGSFTGIEPDLQERLLKAAGILKKSQKIQGIRLSTRPDYINPEVIKVLLKYEVDTVELGVQSLDNEVLQQSERGHRAADVEYAVSLLQRAGIAIGLQLMPGLPGDSPGKAILTTGKAISLAPDFIRIYPTVVIKETKLAQMLADNRYQPWSLEEAVETTALMYIMLSKAGIPVIRLGLQQTENLTAGKDLIAGPYHSAFGELVKSRVFRKQVEMLLLNTNLYRQEADVNLKCNYRDISQVKGQKSVNIRYFKENFHLNLNVSPDPQILPAAIRIELNTGNLFFYFSRREFLEKYRIE